jgi:hypothetical protein
MLVCDEGFNPFYCSVDAATFLHNLRLRLALRRHSRTITISGILSLLVSFASAAISESSRLEQVCMVVQRNRPIDILFRRV